jgi:acyl carrier protein
MANMDTTDEVIRILRDVLQLGERAESLDSSSRLLGGIPEFDSMAVVSLVTAIEEHFDCEFDDDEITERTFETVGSLATIVAGKRAE